MTLEEGVGKGLEHAWREDILCHSHRRVRSRFPSPSEPWLVSSTNYRQRRYCNCYTPLRQLWPCGLIPSLTDRCYREKRRTSGRASWDSTLQQRPMGVLPSKTCGKHCP
jgi:hypothetical protein